MIIETKRPRTRQVSSDRNMLNSVKNSSFSNHQEHKVLRLMNEVRNNGFIAKGIRSRMATEEKPGFKNSSS